MTLKEWTEEQVAETMRYCTFLGDRSKGTIPTGATFLRNYVAQHEGYNKDSQLNEQINFDILTMMSGLNDADNEYRRQLLGEYA